MPRANLIFWFKFTEFTKYVVMAKELQQPVKEVDVYKVKIVWSFAIVLDLAPVQRRTEPRSA
jgi:hypothetical protein